MGAATRVEEAIAHSERQRFDLAALVRAAAGAYGGAFPAKRFTCQVPDEAVEMTGAPDLIVQMLDKLVDNAVDFSADGATISIVLRAESGHVELSVANPGPSLPAETGTRLFESLWQSRAESDKRPHFGLGLYIVRLIAEFHGGTARAENLPESAGRHLHSAPHSLTGRLTAFAQPVTSSPRKFCRYSSQDAQCRAIETLWWQ